MDCEHPPCGYWPRLCFSLSLAAMALYFGCRQDWKKLRALELSLRPCCRVFRSCARSQGYGLWADPQTLATSGDGILRGPLLLCAVAFPLTLLPNQPFGLYLLWSCIVGLGLWAWAPAFWSLPTLLMGESAAAVSLGLINCIGNLGGFFGPWLIGWLIGRSSGWAEGVAALSFAVAAIIILLADLRPRVQIRHPRPESRSLTPIKEIL